MPLPIQPAGDTKEFRVRAAAIYSSLDDIGTLYVWGGKDPEKDGGLDCSGEAVRTFRDAGLSGFPVENADTLFRTLDPIDEERVKPGDLCFYGTSEKATHVVVVLSSGGRAVIGANGGGSLAPKADDETDEAFELRRKAYLESMRQKQAGVRLEDHRHDCRAPGVVPRLGAHYRPDFLGYRRLPWERSSL